MTQGGVDVMPDSMHPNVPLRNVLLLEDQIAIRQMMATLIAYMPSFRVVAQAGDVQEALRLTELHRPDVVVLDWMLAEETGLSFLKTIQSWPVRPATLVFSANTTRHVVQEAFAHGAGGFIEKTSGFSDFTAALQAVGSGRAYLGPTISGVISGIVRSPGPDLSGITPRELEILRMVAEGMSSKSIGLRLGISVRTVHSHRASLIRKTGLHSVAELTRFACDRGVVTSVAPTPNFSRS
jgi:DNA-binding NarL/FixJ family response regulator